MTEQQTEPTVITLDSLTSIQIVSQYIELAQSKGAFILAEAELLKRASDLLLKNVPDTELTPVTSRQLLIQGIHKGQRHGAFTLNDAALLSKVVQYITANIDAPNEASTPTDPQAESQGIQEQSTYDDLSDLAEPIPLKPKEV